MKTNQNDEMVSFLCEKYDSFPYVKFSKEEMLEAIGNNSYSNNLRFVGFCMITPDAVVRHLVTDILSYLESFGFVVGDFQVKYLSEEDIEEVYKVGFTHKILNHRKTHWWLSRKSYSIAPAIGMLVYTNRLPVDYPLATDYLLHFKGGSLPISNYNTESVRYRLGSISKTLALFHSSDNPFEVVREATMFFSWDRIRHVLEMVETDNVSKSSLLCQAMLQPNTANISGFEALYYVKARMLATSIHYLGLHKLNFIWLSSLLDQCSDTIKMLSESKEYRRSKQIVEDSSRLEQSLFQDDDITKVYEAISNISLNTKDIPKWEMYEQKSNLFSLLKLVFSLVQYEYRNINFKDMFNILMANNIYLTQWESICIENIMYFYEDR